MYILIAMFCSGLSCVDAEWPVQPTTAIPHNCMAALGELAPPWLQKHPGYVVRRFKCIPAERMQRDV